MLFMEEDRGSKLKGQRDKGVDSRWNWPVFYTDKCCKFLSHSSSLETAINGCFEMAVP